MFHRINLTFRYLLVTLVSIIISFLLLLLIAQTISWRLSEAKVENYSSSVLERTLYLLRQAQDIAQNNAPDASAPTCSDADIARLRSLLWNYPLIKDIGRANQQGILCSVLWGRPASPVAFVQQARQTKQIDGAAFLHLPVASGIEATALRRNGYIVFLSPFAFTRFENDPGTAPYSALVVNKAGSERYFSVGKGADELAQSIAFSPARWNYIVKKSCSPHDDLCAIAGAPAAGFFSESGIIIGFVVFISLITGTLISLCWHFWRSKKSSLPARLQRALAQEKLSVVYQPVFEIKSGEMQGVEALLRWEDDQVGAISPEIFIPLAEKAGMMRQITEYVTHRAAEEMQALMKQHSLTLSINVSLADLFSADYLRFLLALTRRLDIPAHQLVLEITERQGANLGCMAAAIRRFKDEGFLVALDDFGTGYSNISWLSQLPVDEIKIDKSLSDAINTQSLNKTMLINLLLLLKSMPQKIVFEGLEKASQVDYLREQFPQCYGQGWWYSRPLSQAALVAFIRARK